MVEMTEAGHGPRYLRLHESDNVAVVVSPGGAAAGAPFADGLRAAQAIPQAHKIALQPIGEGQPVRRYGHVIGYARRALDRGAWVEESALELPAPPTLDSLPRCTDVPAQEPPLEGYTLRASATPTAAWARATCSASARWSSAWPACSSTPWPGSEPSCCRATPTSTTWSR